MSPAAVVLDEHGRFVSDHPAVVPRDDGHRRRGLELLPAAVGVLDRDPALDEHADVRVHAHLAAGHRAHVRRPPPARRIDQALQVPRPHDHVIDGEAADLRPLRASNRPFEDRHGGIVARLLYDRPMAQLRAERIPGELVVFELVCDWISAI